MKLTPVPWDWDQPPRDLPPAPGLPSVRLALARLPSDPARLLPHLPTDEHARLARFQRPEDRHRFLAARALLRLLLGAHLRQPPAAVRLQIGPFGKPFIEPAASPLHFNLSHSGDLILIALSHTCEVGIDVEQEQPLPDLPALAVRVFPPPEYHTWLRLPAAEQLPAFYVAWTRHEARLKAHGLGLAREPAAATALPGFDLHLPSGYTGALALIPPPP